MAVSSVFAAPSADAEAEVEKELSVRITAEKSIAWIDANRDAIRRESGLQVLQDLGNGKLKVRRASNKGVFVWITKESIVKRKDGSYVFKSNLVESIEGGVVYSDSEVIAKNVRSGTIIIIKSSVGITNSKVRTGQLRIDMNVHLNRVRKLLEESVR